MLRQRISEIALSAIIGLIIYWAFYYIYKESISPILSYMGYNYEELTFGVHAIAIGFFLLPLLWLPIKPQRASDMTIWLLYMFSYVPTCFMCFHIMEDPFPDAMFLLVVLLTALIIVDLARRHRITLNFHLNVPINIPLDNIIVISSVLLCCYIVYLTKNDFTLNFGDVYERRLAVRGSSSVLTGYILAFGRSVIIVFSVYIAFVKKSKIAFLALTILSIGTFAYDGTKSSLLVPVFLILVYFLTVCKKSNLTLNIILLFIILVSIIEFVSLNSSITSIFFTRRIFAGPGHLNTLFWEYFLVHDKVMMADSIASIFTDTSYGTSPTFIIGYEYFRNVDLNANTGIWMGGYAHFGIIGVVLVSTIAGLIIGLIDNMTRERFKILGFLVCSYIGILWAEQMLHTSMLTGGIFYIFIFLLVYCNASTSRNDAVSFTVQNQCCPVKIGSPAAPHF